MATNAAFLAWYVNTFTYSQPRPASEPDTRFWRLWQMGVNVPIANPHFTYEKKIIHPIQGINLVGTSVIHTLFDTATEMEQFLNLVKTRMYGLVSNDITKIGEIVRINSALVMSEEDNAIDILLDDSLINSYASGSSTLEFFTPQIAEKWDVDSEYLVPMGLVKGFPSDLLDIDGKLQAQQLFLASSSFNATEKKFSSEIPNLQEYACSSNGLYYRIGLRYHISYNTLPASAAPSDAGTIMVKLPGCSAENKILLNYLSGAIYNKYFLYNSYPAFSDWMSFSDITDTAAYRKVEISFTGLASPVSDINFGVDDIYLEHSAGFESSLGCLLMTYAPNRDSLSIGADSNEETIQVSNSDKYPFFPLGNPNKSKKYSISCTFEDSNMDTYQKLRILETWQNNGFNLNLHTHLPELPEVLIGRMKLGAVKKGVFDFTRVSFDFEFTEV
jgi:hypothetical protein